jgi:hypothetical protein
MVTEPARLILVTVFPGVDAFDVAAPAEVFTVANQVLPQGGRATRSGTSAPPAKPSGRCRACGSRPT